MSELSDSQHPESCTRHAHPSLCQSAARSLGQPGATRARVLCVGTSSAYLSPMSLPASVCCKRQDHRQRLRPYASGGFAILFSFFAHCLPSGLLVRLCSTPSGSTSGTCIKASSWSGNPLMGCLCCSALERIGPVQRPSADSFAIGISPQDGLGSPSHCGTLTTNTHHPRSRRLFLGAGNRYECTEDLARVASRTGEHSQGRASMDTEDDKSRLRLV
jgi:hypothetical protein